ncbi:MAG: DUF2207 family protein [Candidatus Fimadaptatus sp.]|jgi:hypothetical protein
MNRGRLVALLLALLMLCADAHAEQLAAMDAVVESFDADYVVREDGVIAAEERVVYKATGDMDALTRDMTLARGSSYGEFSVSKVCDGVETRLDEATASGGEGAYSRVRSGDGADRYCINLPCARGDSVELIYRYNIYGECERYADLGVIDMPLLSDAWKLKIYRYTARISFEGGSADGMDVRAIHNGMGMLMHEAKDGGYVFDGRSVGEGNAIKVRLTFPQELIRGMDFTGDRPMQDGVLTGAVAGSSDEADMTMQSEAGADAEHDANAQRYVRLGWVIFAVMTAVAALMLLAAALLWGRKTPARIDEYMGGMELPSTMGATPAEMCLNLRAKIGAEAMTATLLDLARRKYILIELDGDITYVRSGKSERQCAPHERFAMDWIFSMGKAGRVSLRDIKAFVNRGLYRGELYKWRRMVRSAAKARGWYEPHTLMHKLLITLSLLLSAVVTAITWEFGGEMHDAITIALGIGSEMFLLSGWLSHRIRRHTPEGAQNAADWDSVAYWIMSSSWDGDEMQLDVAELEQLMAYAPVLGVEEELACRLKELGKECAGALRSGRGAVLLREADGSMAKVYGACCERTIYTLSNIKYRAGGRHYFRIKL